MSPPAGKQKGDTHQGGRSVAPLQWMPVPDLVGAGTTTPHLTSESEVANSVVLDGRVRGLQEEEEEAPL